MAEIYSGHQHALTASEDGKFPLPPRHPNFSRLRSTHEEGYALWQRLGGSRMDASTTKKIYTVDGRRFSTLAECAVEFTQVLGLTMPWNGHLDAFNDFLNGGFGTPDEGFVLIWQRSDLSRQRLGYGETLRWLEEKLHRCHPANVARVQAEIAAARRQQGETLFDILVQILRNHEDIELRLE